ncbi:MAG: pilin, partial [Rhodoferax sp.]|nr:pilin [Rhodoferax sp.]
VVVSGTLGVITVTTGAAAGAGTIIVSPYTGGTDVYGTGGVALPTAVALTPIPTPATVVKWRCKGVGAAGFGAQGTLLDKYLPGECR